MEIVRLYSNLLPGPETFSKLLVSAKSTRRPRERPAARQAQLRLDPDQAAALAMAYRAGEATKELAAHFGIHRATVTALLHRLGVDLRQRGLTDAQSAEAPTLSRGLVARQTGRAVRRR